MKEIHTRAPQSSPNLPQNLRSVVSFGGIDSSERKSSCKVAALLLFALVFLHLPAWGAQSVTLGWDACSATNITGYNLYYGGASGSYTNKVSVGAITAATVSGLTKGRTYYFAATSMNTSGLESPLSTEVNYTLPNPVILSLKAVRTNNMLTSVTVSASGGVPTKWGLLASADMKSWTTIAHGTNTAVNVSVPASGMPIRFYRLASE